MRRTPVSYIGRVLRLTLLAPNILEAILDGRQGIVTPPRTCGRSGGPVAKGMKKISYSGYRFPPEIIHQAIWLYLRFTP